MKDYALCLGNIKDFTINNMTKKKKKITELKEL